MGSSRLYSKWISTHAPAGGATRRDLLEMARMLKISTHAPAGGATQTVPAPAFGRQHFYSRPCGRGDWNCTLRATTQILFLLTPLREGRPVIVGKCAYCREISTHAPAGGATCFDGTFNPQYPISTHAPAGGATLRSLRLLLHRQYFYSRPCGRGDRTVPDAGIR